MHNRTVKTTHEYNERRTVSLVIRETNFKAQDTIFCPSNGTIIKRLVFPSAAECGGSSLGSSIN